MEFAPYFKSIVDQDTLPVVISNLEHVIIYMNPAAEKEYLEYGGLALIGTSLFDCHQPSSVEKIKKVVSWFEKDVANNQVHTFFSDSMQADVYMVALRDETGKLIGYYEKHEVRVRDTRECYAMP